MIHILHGENIIASRSELQKRLAEFPGEKVTLDAKDLTAELLTQNLQGNSLFGTEKRLVIIETILSNKGSLEGLIIPQANTDLILWESKKMSVAQLLTIEKKLGKLNVQEFKIDPVVFKFVESISPGNQKLMIPLFRQYLSAEEPEMAFAMIVRQVRLILLVKSNSNVGPDDYLRLSPWQKTKIQEQAKNFTPGKLQELFSSLLALDYQNKSGQSMTDFSSSIELLLLSL